MNIILGYLDFNNYGDELLANLLETKLKAKYGSDTITQRLSLKKSFIEHIKLISSSKRIFAIGGMFQDLSGPWSIYYYSLIIFLAKILSKEIIIFAQGIGPLQNPINKLLTQNIFKLANKISVRDLESSMFLKEINIEHTLVSDWAWTLIDEVDNIDIKKFSGLKNNSTCIALRNSKFINDKFLKKLANEINASQKNIIFLEMQDGDHLINKDLKKLLNPSLDVAFIEAKNFSAQELIYLFKNFCVEIYSMRYHAGLIAKIAGIEVNLIDCDPKMVNLSKQISQNSIDELLLQAQLSEYLL
jgi:polysaccharide pyruvyl transferase WcaK-like protein